VAASQPLLSSQCVAAAQPRVELVYAHFQGAADNYATQAPDIQAQFAAVDANYMNYDAQHYFGIGLHLNVECDSSNQPVVHDVALSTPISSSNYSTIVSNVQSAGYCHGGGSCTGSGAAHYWVYTDGNPVASLGYAGQSSIIGDDSSGSGNQINQSDAYSINYGYCLNPAAGTSACNAPIDTQGPGYGPSIFAHENGHALGAVQLSAPESSGAWHCTDGLDVMCYNDGGSKSGSYTTTACADAPNGTAIFDCNFNDYFNPGPAAGSYLATHWDVASPNNRWVQIQPASSNTSLQASASSAGLGQPVTFTATTTGSTTPHPGAPTGSVTFADGSTSLGSVALNTAGQAALSTSSLSTGAHTITATFSGSGVYSSSASAGVAVQIGQMGSQTTLVSSQNPSLTTGSVTLTATVAATGSGGGTPTGSVTFWNAASTIGSLSLNSGGSASVTLSGLTVGTYQIHATYPGDSTYSPSSSPMLQQHVLLPSQTLLTSSAVNQISAVGASLTFSVSVQPTSSGNPLPTGSVTFTDAGIVLGTVALDGTGKATLSTTTLPVGSHGVTATYLGDTSYAPSNATTSVSVTTWTLGLNLHSVQSGWMSPMLGGGTVPTGSAWDWAWEFTWPESVEVIG
jgi:hypothetical protein